MSTKHAPQQNTSNIPVLIRMPDVRELDNEDETLSAGVESAEAADGGTKANSDSGPAGSN